MCVIFFRFIAGFEFKIKKFFAFCITVFLVSSSVLSAYLNGDDLIISATEILTLISFCVVPYSILKSKGKLAFLAFGLSANAVIDFLTLALCYILKTDEIIIQNTIFICYILFFSVILYVVYKRFGTVTVSEIFANIPKSIYIVVFLLTQSVYYFWMVSVDAEFDINIASTLLIIFAVSLILCLAMLIARFVKNENSKLQYLSQIEMQTEKYENLINNNREIRKFKHDYSNSMISLYSLVNAGKNEEALEFIEKMNQKIETATDLYTTGNFMADAILSHFASEARVFGISISFSGSIPADKITNNDITGILSNSLTNAIEACKDIENSTITIISKEYDDGVVVTMENPVKKDIVIKDNHIVTTKRDKTNHGFGLSNISDIVNKYNGFVSLKSENKTFIIKIGLRF